MEYHSTYFILTSKPDGFIFSEILSKKQIRKAIEKYIDTK